MKKIIILIAILCEMGFCDTIIKIYNKTSGQIIKTFTSNDCNNNSLWILDGIVNDLNISYKGMYGIVLDKKNFKQLNVGCDYSKYNNKEPIILGTYDGSLFAFSVEYIEQSLR